MIASVGFGAWALYAFQNFNIALNSLPALAAMTKSDFRQHADRLVQIRGSGSASDGLHTIMQSVKINDDDYLLMGCDNSSAARNFPNVDSDTREEGRWFSGATNLTDKHFGNSHGNIRKDGTVEIESFYTSLPRKEYQASPEEVAWHYVRVKQLRAEGMPTDKRISTMTAEAKDKPWLTMQ